MKLENQNILFFTRTMGVGGTENVILQLVDIFSPRVNKIVVCSCGGVNEKCLENMHIKHYLISDIEDKSPKTIVSTLKLLNEIVKRENITLIHTHHRMAAFYVRLLRLDNKCIFVNTSHNVFMNKKFLTSFSYKTANLIACGSAVKRNLTEFYKIPNEQVQVIHNAVKSFDKDIEEDKILCEYRKKGYFLVGNIGRLSEQKGLEYYINAIPQILQIHPMTMFFLVGIGEKEENLKKIVIKLQIQDYVVFMGYRNDVQNLMSQLDLIVLSSLWEGLPLTPIEAFSVGKTIVATDVDGTGEIVKNEINGLLVPDRDSESIAKAVNKLIFDTDKRKKFEIKARRYYEKYYSYDVFAKNYLDYFQKLTVNNGE